MFLFINPQVKAQVVINEFVPDSTQEWIELFNSSESAEYLRGYYIDDDTEFQSDLGSSAKKILTNLNTSNPKFPTIDTTSFLNNSGDWVVLFDPNGLLIDKYQFQSNPGKDISIGRFPDGTGNFSILAYSTKADANSAPPTSPPTPTPTPSPTPTENPTPTPTKTPSPTPTKTPKPTPTKTPIPTDTLASESSVLGIRESLPETPDPTPDAGNDKEKLPVLPFILIFAGLCFIAVPIFSIIRNGKKGSEVP